MIRYTFVERIACGNITFPKFSDNNTIVIHCLTMITPLLLLRLK